MSDTKALATTPKSIFEDPIVQERFRKMLKENTAGFITSIIQIINDNKDLQKADRNSLLFASANAASMNLPINPNLGFAYIIPYKTKQKQTVEKDGREITVWTEIVKAQFQMGYKGFIQLAQRSGQFQKINAVQVYESDNDEDVYARLTAIIPKPPKSTKVIGYAGYFKLTNGFEKIHYMTITELKGHGTKYSQSFKRGYGLWEDNFEAMAIKTVLKLLLSKFAPLSLDMQRAVTSDQAELEDWDGTPKYLDNENKKPTLDENNKEKEEARLKDWVKNSKTAEQLAEANEAVYASGNTELIELYEKRQKDLDVDIEA